MALHLVVSPLESRLDGPPPGCIQAGWPSTCSAPLLNVTKTARPCSALLPLNLSLDQLAQGCFQDTALQRMRPSGKLRKPYKKGARKKTLFDNSITFQFRCPTFNCFIEGSLEGGVGCGACGASERCLIKPQSMVSDLDQGPASPGNSFLV